MIPEGWEKHKIAEIGKVITGKTPSSNNPGQFGNKIPFITPTDFRNYNKNIYQAERGISEDGIKNFKNKILPINAILVSCIGSDMGKVAINKTVCLTNQQINSIIVDERKASSDFVYYMLTSKYKVLKGLATGGSTMPIINKGDFEDIELIIPISVDNQSRIASILSSLDDKIELNLQMNKTLEAIAQAIFKEWFVEFRFPGFDGELVDRLPKGWRRGALGDEFSIIMGQSPPGESYNEKGDGIIFFQGRADFGFRFPKNRIYTTDPKRSAKKNNTLVSVRAPVGDMNIASEDCCIGRGLASVIHKKDFYSYTYYLLNSLKRIFNGFEAEGTVFGSINKSDFAKIEIIVPAESVIQAFERLFNPIDEKISANILNTELLVQIRDLLLPKLMTGKIRVA